MTKEEIINLTESWLMKLNDDKQELQLITELLEDANDIDFINRFTEKQQDIRFKISKVVRVIGDLNEEKQKLICYKYFDKLSKAEICRRLDIPYGRFNTRLNKIILEIGRLMFGMEEEFWNKIFLS